MTHSKVVKRICQCPTYLLGCEFLLLEEWGSIFPEGQKLLREVLNVSVKDGKREAESKKIKFGRFNFRQKKEITLSLSLIVKSEETEEVARQLRLFDEMRDTNELILRVLVRKRDVDDTKSVELASWTLQDVIALFKSLHPARFDKIKAQPQIKVDGQVVSDGNIYVRNAQPVVVEVDWGIESPVGQNKLFSSRCRVKVGSNQSQGAETYIDHPYGVSLINRYLELIFPEDFEKTTRNLHFALRLDEEGVLAAKERSHLLKPDEQLDIKGLSLLYRPSRRDLDRLAGDVTFYAYLPEAYDTHDSEFLIFEGEHNDKLKYVVELEQTTDPLFVATDLMRITISFDSSTPVGQESLSASLFRGLVNFELRLQPHYTYSLSVDLGTSAICIAKHTDFLSVRGEPSQEVVLLQQNLFPDSLESDKKLFPSLVARRGRGVDGGDSFILLNRQEQAVNYEADIVPNVKSMMLLDHIKLPNAEERRPATDVVSEVFSSIIEQIFNPEDKANWDLPCPEFIQSVVFTRPNNYTIRFRKVYDHVYQTLAKVLGFKARPNGFDLVSESEAVLIKYLVRAQFNSSPRAQRVIVLDIGAGTTDLTLAEVKWGRTDDRDVQANVIGNICLPLGGNYYDYLIAEAIVKWLGKDFASVLPSKYLGDSLKGNAIDSTTADFQTKLKSFVKDKFKPFWIIGNNAEPTTTSHSAHSHESERSLMHFTNVSEDKIEEVVKGFNETVKLKASSQEDVVDQNKSNYLGLLRELADQKLSSALSGEKEVSLKDQIKLATIDAIEDIHYHAKKEVEGDYCVVVSGRASRFALAREALLEKYGSEHVIFLNDKPDESDEKYAVALGAPTVVNLHDQVENSAIVLKSKARPLYRVYAITIDQLALNEGILDKGVIGEIKQIYSPYGNVEESFSLAPAANQTTLEIIATYEREKDPFIIRTSAKIRDHVRKSLGAPKRIELSAELDLEANQVRVYLIETESGRRELIFPTEGILGERTMPLTEMAGMHQNMWPYRRELEP